MRRINILYVDDVFDFGGGERHLLLLISHLDKQLYNISVACREISILYYKTSKLGLQVLPIRFRNKFDIIGLFSFYRLLKQSNYDIVHLQDNRSHWLGSIAAKMAGVPIIIATVHMVNILRHKDTSRIYRFILKLADQIWSSLVDMIITVSESNKAALMAEGIVEKKINVIYNGIEDSKPQNSIDSDFKMRYNIKENEIIIGTVARLSVQKGLVYLIRAAKDILKRHQRLRLVIVGDGPEKQRLIDEADMLGIMERTIFIGFKEKAMDYTALFDIFVLPSVYEGLPIAIIEAMSQSVPVVATFVAGIPEVVKNGISGLLVAPKDVKGLAEAIERLIIDKDMRCAMGIEGRQIFKDKFSIRQMSYKTDGIYQSLFAKK